MGICPGAWKITTLTPELAKLQTRVSERSPDCHSDVFYWPSPHSGFSDNNSNFPPASLTRWTTSRDESWYDTNTAPITQYFRSRWERHDTLPSIPLSAECSHCGTSDTTHRCIRTWTACSARIHTRTWCGLCQTCSNSTWACSRCSHELGAEDMYSNTKVMEKNAPRRCYEENRQRRMRHEILDSRWKSGIVNTRQWVGLIVSAWDIRLLAFPQLAAFPWFLGNF